MLTALLLATTVAMAPITQAQGDKVTSDRKSVYGAELEGYDYPYPVQRFQFASQKRTLQMAYMDVNAGPGRPVIVLMHGKNFCSATWKASIEVLANEGYRIIAMDQIGFCKSTKPDSYQYSFQQLARNTHELLASLHIAKATFVAHSTGGMIAIRYALMYPEAMRGLVLVDPIGLEDWKAKGVPSISVDDWYRRELQSNEDRIREYEQTTYYAGTWKDSYEQWVQMLAGMYRGSGKDLVAWNSALLYDMIYTQPVFYEFERLAVPTLLMIGDKDNTAIGKDLAPPEVRARLGNYPVLAKQAVSRIPDAKLIEFPDLGHAPQIQDPEVFHHALLEGLSRLNAR